MDLKVADDSGIFYGGQAGIAMTISEVVQIDLSYKYSLTTLEEMEYDSLILAKMLLESNLDNMGTISIQC